MSKRMTPMPLGRGTDSELDRALTFGRLHLLRINRRLTKLKLHAAPSKQGFFDLYERFYSSSVTSATANRLNQRYQALIEANKELIRGKSVLDIASHDGRWSFAACKSGALHVLGIEARDHLVKAAYGNMEEYKIPADQYNFVLGDVFDVIGGLPRHSIETVFCFGFFYHTMQHMLLLSKIDRLSPRNVIIDTEISLDPSSMIRVKAENIAGEGAAAIATPGTPTHTIVGRPSKSALELMLSSFGWSWTYYDWHHAGIQEWDDLVEYYEGRRITVVAQCTRPAWEPLNCDQHPLGVLDTARSVGADS